MIKRKRSISKLKIPTEEEPIAKVSSVVQNNSDVAEKSDEKLPINMGASNSNYTEYVDDDFDTSDEEVSPTKFFFITTSCSLHQCE